MNRFVKVCLCFLVFVASGCYEEKVKEAVSNLRVGMTKAEFQNVCKDLEFLKEQVVTLYPNTTEEEMRGSLGPGHEGDRHPERLADQFTFDGNTKVYSYLIRREKVFANPTFIEHLVIFYNLKGDKVIGWGNMKTAGDVETWRDRF